MFDTPEDNRQREKFPPRDREFNNRPRRDDFGDRGRRDFANGYGNAGFKRGSGRRDDEVHSKRGRFDSASDTFEPQFNSRDEHNAIPPLMTFRKFLMTQDEGVSDPAEAVKKYNEYKADYLKNAANRFFEAHKEEEWFHRKYFPGQFEKRLEEKKAAISKRLDVFTSLSESGDINTSLDYTNSLNLIRLLDIAVVKLEDGSDEEIEAIRLEDIVDEALVELSKLDGIESETKSASNGTHNGASKVSESGDRKKSEAHKTSSIVFKNIPPNVSVEDLENVCKQYPGFLRLGLSEPLADQKFVRFAWASFRRDVNVKEIFWGLKATKLGDVDLGASVNRDIRRRIRWVDGITRHRAVAQNDLKLAAKLVVIFDFKAGLFMGEEEKPSAPTDLELAIARSKNPVLSDITEYLIEEANAEEDLLLGISESSGDHSKQAMEVDEAMLKTLDKIILYLRIVHSYDFYAHLPYSNEDMMPNRLGILHVRGVFSDGNEHGQSANGQPLIPQSKINDYIKEFSDHFDSILKFEILTEEELAKLGKREPEKAVEEFIENNTVELGKEKWLCPLSGKKFKGPEFIQKHLQSKHQERLDQERDLAVFFNNYISDPDRPQDAEPKAPAPPATQTVSTPHSEERPDRPRERVVVTERTFPRFGSGGGFGHAGFGRGGGRYFDRAGGDRRHQASYRDLDAPED